MKRTIPFVVTLILIIFFSIAVSGNTSPNGERIFPMEQRNETGNDEFLFDRNQYWTSSVLHIQNEAWPTLSTRATSMDNHISYDLFISFSGKQCERMRIMIYTDRVSIIEDVDNQSGMISFDSMELIPFKFSIRTFKGSNAIGFHPIKGDSFLALMKKNLVLRIEMPFIEKLIFYDLRGFSASLQKVQNMCRNSRPKK